MSRKNYQVIVYGKFALLDDDQRAKLLAVADEQRHVEAILPLAEEWIAPFVIHLVGEYVLEIVLRIKVGLADVATPGSTMNAVYGRFAAANPDFVARTAQRPAAGTATTGTATRNWPTTPPRRCSPPPPGSPGANPDQRRRGHKPGT